VKRFCILLIIAAAALFSALAQKTGSPFTGRWDMTVEVGSSRYPSWLEVTEESGNIQARVQQITGNVAPVAAVKMEGQRLIITVTTAAAARPASENRPAFPGRPELVWELTEKGGKLTGAQKSGATVWQLTGVHAPAMKPAPVKTWAEPEPLFNGKDLSGWEPINNTPDAADSHFLSHWAVKDGELTNEARGSNLRTTRTFKDFKLHVEFNCPPDENSGVYLRGREETQVVGPPDPARRPAPAASKGLGPGMGGGYRNPFPGIGCIYGMLGPSTPPAYRPDWQTYDITLIGRWVTVVFNGVTTIDNQEIAGVTGGAIDSNEAEPGPIYLQGDHHGGIRYRNMTISVAKH
jgi:3-keto-disaccharide hydrolase